MNRSLSLHSDQLPIDQALWQEQQQPHQVHHAPERTANSQSACFGDLQDDLFLYDPCSAVEQWADSSPGRVPTKQNPCELEKSQDYPPCSLSHPSGNLPPSNGEGTCAFSSSDPSHQQHFSAANVPVQMTTRPDTNPVKLALPSLGRFRDQSSSDWVCGTESNTQCGFDPRSFYPSPISQESHTHCEPSPPPQMAIQIPSSPISLDTWCEHGSPASGKTDHDPEIDRNKTTLKSMPELRRHDIPYSRLIETALRQSPDNKLSLQGIYSWFRENTLRGQDKSKGWQNSIRHNLSMNAVCASLFFFFFFGGSSRSSACSFSLQGLHRTDFPFPSAHRHS